MNDQIPNSDISELHRLRRELLEEQDRVQRLSAQLSTNVSTTECPIWIRWILESYTSLDFWYQIHLIHMGHPV